MGFSPTCSGITTTFFSFAAFLGAAGALATFFSFAAFTGVEVASSSTKTPAARWRS